MLTAHNYKKGILVDEELMGGVSPDPELPDAFIAYVLRHTTAEYLGYRKFEKLEDALAAINSVERSWKFEKTGGCGGCKNDDQGTCVIGGCGGDGCGADCC